MSAPALLGDTRHHVLLVDDTSAMRALYGRFLELDGYRVSTAASGAEALALLALEVPDLILLDHMMPGMSGAEVLAQIRRQPRLADIPTVFLTASTLDLDEAFGLGASDYFVKPIDRRMLLARVRALTSSRRVGALERDRLRLEADHGRLMDEVSEARAAQAALVPAMPVSWPGWIADAALRPCTTVAGDTFDVVAHADGARTVCLVDVSGHGMASALVAADVRSALRYLVVEHRPEEALLQLNHMLCARSGEHYACVALCRIDGNEVTVVNAGLPPVVCVAAGASPWEVSGCGLPPGLLDDATYTRVTHRVGPGCRILLASDGMMDLLGEATLTAQTARRIPAPGSGKLRAWLDAMPAALDDATLIVVENLATAGPPRGR